ncbi:MULTISPECIES: alpha/beta fold hydrolase [unclassified Streptomyces]|uniref:alpha/beta fold hydrolase n=1 Tax=unclassified Streptomyces TaxID=2593676 RepID=UPI002E2E6158|nr:alpha/beta hydrolase [Streptomyces sp. NBC_00223]
MTQPLAATPAATPAQEFADLLDGRPADFTPPVIQRRWLNVTAGGHVSGVFWHADTPGVLLLHDAGSSARAWDAVLLELGRPAVAVDLPGHGRSSARQRGDYRPRRLAGSFVEAAHSFAPAGTPVVGTGLGALTAVAASAKAPGRLGRVVLVDTLPGALAALGNPWPTASPDFADPEEARAWLAERRGAADDRTVRQETVQGPDGRWAWRHRLGDLPDNAPATLDDETLWERLAALPAPLLVRTAGGPLDDTAADRFTAEVKDGETVTVEPGPAALAALLRDLLP